MSAKPKVLLIGWDGADWEHIDPLLEAGLMPTLDGLINRGVMGNLATLEPVLSPMLWNSVATGKLPAKHGIHGFVEPDPVNGGMRPYASTSRKVKAVWNILTQSGLKSNIIGWWASHPAEPIDGCIVTSHFNSTRFSPGAGFLTMPGTIHPQEKSDFLAQFRVFPHELTHEHVMPFIPHADRLDQENDPLVQGFGRILSSCASTHAVATAVMETEPWDFMAIYYDAIDHFCHGFMQFHPPRMEHVPEERFELYKDVVTGAYRFHDMMLERLLSLAGPDTTVVLCSDHGFQSREQRPTGIPREPAGPAVWHRQFGIFVAKGPGIKRDERIYGASLIDICPTLLVAMGLPVGADMDGRPLTEIYEQPPKIETIASWEDVPGECGMHPPGFTMSTEDSDELLQQFVALGYVEDPGEDKQLAAENAEIEAKYNVARSLLWTGRSDEAIELLEDISRRRPWETRFLGVLAHAYHRSGYLRQAERLIAASYPDTDQQPASIRLLAADIQAALGNPETALSLYEQAGRSPHCPPRVLVQIGETYLRLRRFRDAERVFRQAIDVHPDTARAWQGLSTVYRRWGKNEETATAALNAVGLIYRSPVAHFNLGVALARSGDLEKARLAFETALKCRPHMIPAHRWLAAVYAQDSQLADKAEFHKLEVARLQAEQQTGRQVSHDRREQLFDLPDIPPMEERLALLNKFRPLPADKKEKSGKAFVLVSGLPRSGTSLMMQMLEAGGLAVVTDGERAADNDNPKGYYEWEAVKQIGKRPELLDELSTVPAAIKVVSALLQSMPVTHQYKVLFMMRPIDEIVASQGKMLQRQDAQGARLSEDQLQRALIHHRRETRMWLQQARHMDVLDVDYPALVQSPETVIPKIVEFLGDDSLPDAARMQSVIDPALHRQKGETPGRGV